MQIEEGTTVITKSYSYKLNVQNYESRDFFDSQSAVCKIEDSDRVADQLSAACRRRVIKDVNAELNIIRSQGRLA